MLESITFNRSEWEYYDIQGNHKDFDTSNCCVFKSKSTQTNLYGKPFMQFRHFAQGHLMVPSSTRLGIEKARSINLLVFSIQSLDRACVVHPPLFCHCFWFCHKNIIFDTKYFCISINHIITLVSIDLSNNSTS